MEYANESIRHGLWARLSTRCKERPRKLTGSSSVLWLTKGIRILFRCWQARIPCDELRYLKSLQKSRSPLLPSLAQPPTTIP